MGVKIIRRQGEPLGLTLRRLKKIMERSGIFRELRDHSHYAKPSEKRRQKERKRQYNIKNPKPQKDAVPRTGRD